MWLIMILNSMKTFLYTVHTTNRLFNNHMRIRNGFMASCFDTNPCSRTMLIEQQRCRWR
jgi:hypothetical protein